MKHLIFAILILGMTHCSFAAQPGETRDSITPQQVLQRLKEGNQRFLNANTKERDLLKQLAERAEKQSPIAVVLNCMDSRTPPELIFDQGIGDIFAIRIAGNILNDDILGSMEFGTKVMHSKLIAVIGHTNCGAIKGSCEQVELGYLTDLLKKIQPAVIEARREIHSHDCKNPHFIDQVAKNNVILVMQEIQTQSPIIGKLLKEKKIGMIGGIQDFSTGKVTFFNGQNVN